MTTDTVVLIFVAILTATIIVLAILAKWISIPRPFVARPLVLQLAERWRIDGSVLASRQKALAALARRWGADFDRTESYDLPSQYKGFCTIEGGHAYNVLSCSRKGRKLVGFDQFRLDGNGEYTVWRVSMLALGGLVRWPELYIVPGNYPEANRVRFESDEFNRRFTVMGTNPRFAYDVINPKMMEHLLAHGKEWRLEMAGAWLLVSDARSGAIVGLDEGNAWAPHRFDAGLAMAEGFLDRVPEFVWKDHRSDGEEIGAFLPRKRHIGIAPQRIAGKPGMG
jgi:hypothetical protein